MGCPSAGPRFTTHDLLLFVVAVVRSHETASTREEGVEVGESVCGWSTGAKVASGGGGGDVESDEEEEEVEGSRE